MKFDAVNVLGNDTHPEDDELMTSLIAGPSNGALTLNPDGTTYRPNAGFTGTDTFTYTVNDGTSTSSAATVRITVTA